MPPLTARTGSHSPNAIPQFAPGLYAATFLGAPAGEDVRFLRLRQPVGLRGKNELTEFGENIVNLNRSQVVVASPTPGFSLQSQEMAGASELSCPT